MDLQKAKIFLEKINREFNRMLKEPENIARIDVDIICAYTREMYDAFLSEKTTVPVVSKPVTAPRAEPIATPQPVEFTPERPAPRVRREPEVETGVSPQFKATPVAATPAHSATPPPKETAPLTTPTPTSPLPAAEPAPVALPDAEILFEEKKAFELSEKLAQTRIPDLTRAIGLNDRSLFTKELFGGNKTVFENTLSAINQLSQFAQAKSYLLEHCVYQYDWMNKSKQAFAKDFIQLVRRRFN